MLRGKSPFLPSPAQFQMPPMLSNTLAKRPPGAPLPPDPSSDASPYLRMPQGYAPPATAPALASIRSGARRRVRR